MANDKKFDYAYNDKKFDYLQEGGCIVEKVIKILGQKKNGNQNL